MNRLIRRFLLGISFISPLFLFSCLETDSGTDRTEITERTEIDSAVSKLNKGGFDVDTSALGSYYVIYKTGTGDYPEPGDTCSIIYTGFFLNGVIFDASYFHYTDSIFKVVFMKDPMITGFNEAISLLNKGAKADFIIPSKLAYGPAGYMDIPPYTPLVFNMKMKDLKPKK